MLRPNPLRWPVIDRLTLAGYRHAAHLLDRHTTPALRPARHAVVFLFHQPPHGLDDGLRIAQRMFLHADNPTDRTADLTAILTALADRVRDYRRARHSPLARIIDRHEPMTRQARYLATATTSLDPLDPDDAHADPAAPRAWRGLARLVDDTRLLLRHTLDPVALVPDTAGLHVATTHTLAVHTPLEPFGRQRAWRYLTETDPADPDADRAGLVAAQTALHRLHALIIDSEYRSRHRRAP